MAAVHTHVRVWVPLVWLQCESTSVLSLRGTPIMIYRRGELVACDVLCGVRAANCANNK